MRYAIHSLRSEDGRDETRKRFERSLRKRGRGQRFLQGAVQCDVNLLELLLAELLLFGLLRIELFDSSLWGD